TDSERNVHLSRHYIGLGAPPKWRMYDLPPLHWLYQTGKQEQVDFLTDDDLEGFSSSKQLAHLYDLIVFPSYDEYDTTHTYDLITGYRNRGGNLMFLSATNFLWRVARHGNRITRIEQWRFLGRPESSLVGVQYRGSDEGEHRGRYVLSEFGRRSWVFAGVDLSQLSAWHWFGIEYDMTTSRSPRGIHVLGRVNPHMGNGRLRGVMTYYQRGQAKVFAGGTLNFPGSMCYPPYRRVLENIWDRLSQP
ncbi:MAG TPA: N,N-dimethylformamidase beta subunit family domain-containing protein, partial [Gaiellaceae bacterium]|nr:N,N-dimethylformamidase beta subunit family domain-containing protein [Gaiellaceae bacterium]